MGLFVGKGSFPAKIVLFRSPDFWTQIIWLLNPNHVTFEGCACQTITIDSSSRVAFWDFVIDHLIYNGQGPQMRAECSRLEIPHSDVNCLLSEMLKQFWRQKPGSEFMGHIRDRRLLPFIVQWCPNFLHKKCGDDVTQKEERRDWKWKSS